MSKIKLLMLNPNWHITEDLMNSRSYVQKLVKHVITQLEMENVTQMTILKMQFYFLCNMDQIGNVIREHREALSKQLDPLKWTIFKTDNLKDRAEIEDFKRQIISYCILKSGLGNPTESLVYEEGFMALKSIMDEGELKDFTGLSSDEKERQLEEMSHIICGIRLFNKDSEKGGTGIPNLPELLQSALEVVKADIQQTLLKLMERVNLLTTAVDNTYVIQEDENEYSVKLVLPSDVNPNYMPDVKKLLIFYRQYEIYVRKVLDEINNINKRSSQTRDNFKDCLKQAHNVVFMKIATPVYIIFPLFIRLSKIWAQFQNEIVLLSKYQQIVCNLEKCSKNVSFDAESLVSILGESQIFTDAERLETTADLTLESDNENVQIFTLSNFQNIDKVKMQYLGFCPWKFVESGGGLVPGNPSMGVVRYNNMNYVFSIPEACKTFSKKPEEYIKHVLQLSREQPELISFLGLHEQLNTTLHLEKLVEDKIVIVKKEDKETQCQLIYEEMVPPNEDRDYKWNIWDYKREALMFANMSHKKTTSTQTVKSHSRNVMKTQTYTYKTQGCQTNRDNYTNVPRPLNFIYGLRARRDNKQFIVNLTRPVTE